MATIFFLGNTPIDHPIGLRGQRLANFVRSLAPYPFRVLHGTVFDPAPIYPAPIDPNTISTIEPFNGAPIASDAIWAKLLEQLPPQIEVLFLADSSLWQWAQKIKAQPAYRQTRLVVDLSNLSDIPDIFAQADHIFVSSEQAYKAAHNSGIRAISLVRDGVYPLHVDEYFLRKWRARLPHFPWALTLLAENTAAVYDQIISSFGASLGCVPIDSRAVFLGGDPYALSKQFKECPYGELNMSRLQALGDISQSDFAAVTQLAPVYALGDFSGDTHFYMTAQALFSQARIVAYRSALIGFEAFLEDERITLVDDASQFHAALRRVLTLPPWEMNATQASAWQVQQQSLSAAVCFGGVAPTLLALLGAT